VSRLTANALTAARCVAKTRSDPSDCEVETPGDGVDVIDEYRKVSLGSMDCSVR
jgi:hypothetical protein